MTEKPDVVIPRDGKMTRLLIVVMVVLVIVADHNKNVSILRGRWRVKIYPPTRLSLCDGG